MLFLIKLLFTLTVEPLSWDENSDFKLRTQWTVSSLRPKSLLSFLFLFFDTLANFISFANIIPAFGKDYKVETL